jgi:2-methylcitrate dehydratase PrpD
MCDGNKNITIEAMTANVLDSCFENFDYSTIEAAKHRIIDIIGCTVGGAYAAGNSELIDLVKDWGGKREATILIHGGKAPAHNVAMANAIMSRSYDFEVMSAFVEGRIFASHHSPTTVMTAMAVGEAQCINGKELISAIIVGDDITARLIASSGIDLGLGWDGSGTYTTFGAAAIAGRLIGLNRRQMKNAFGIVLNNVGSTIQGIWDGATAFKYSQGTAAMNGIIAAELAKKGWKGADDAFFGRYGFFNLYTHGCKNPEILTEDLGRKYYAESLFKPYPCCRATHTTIDAALALVSRHDINPDDIESVCIYAPQRLLDLFVGKPFQIREYPHCDAIFSLQYTCATALLRHSVKQEHFTDEAICDPKINDLINITILAPLPNKTSMGVEVRIKMKGGRELSEFAKTAKGDPIGKPLSKAEIISKYMSQVEFSGILSQDTASKLLHRLLKLENVENINDVINLLNE